MNKKHQDAARNLEKFLNAARRSLMEIDGDGIPVIAWVECMESIDNALRWSDEVRYCVKNAPETVDDPWAEATGGME